MSVPTLHGKDATDGLMDAQTVAGRSLWADARARFFKNKAAVAGLFVLAFVGAFALGILIISRQEGRFQLEIENIRGFQATDESGRSR